MPNWCMCKLLVEGEKEELSAFRKAAKTDSTSLSFNALAPIPTANAATFMETWQSSRPEARDSVDIVDESDTHVVYLFDTAWFPPRASIIIASTNFPNLNFNLEYIEPGGDFYGHEYLKGGLLMSGSEKRLFDSYKANTLPDYVYDLYPNIGEYMQDSTS